MSNNLSCNESSVLVESGDELGDLRKQVENLSAQNDAIRQELHEVYRKMEIDALMHKELKERNILLEQSLALEDKKVQDAREKFAAEKNNYIKEFEETIYQLQEKIKLKQDMLEKVMEEQKKLVTPVDSTFEASKTTEDLTSPLLEKISDLTAIITERDKVQLQLQGTVTSLENECCEIKEILKVTKEQLVETSKVLENTQDELSMCRVELNSLKTVPQSDDQKGNSIFAEVEDRRQKMLNEMKDLRAAYKIAKRTITEKEAEINRLNFKIAKILESFKDEEPDENEELLREYKNRISHLEQKLKEEQSKATDKPNTEILSSTCSYLESLLKTKKIEIDKLEKKVEDMYLHNIFREEAKYRAEKQRKFWKQKAMITETKLTVLTNYLKSHPTTSSSNVLKYLQAETEFKECDQEIEISKGIVPITSEETTLRKLSKNQPPLTHMKNNANVTLRMNAESHESSFLNETMIDMDLTEPIPSLRTNNSTSSIAYSNSKHFTEKIDNIGKATNEEINSHPQYTTKFYHKSHITKSCLNQKTISDFSDRKDKKSVNFTAGTVDPPQRPAKRNTEHGKSYPMLFISSKPKE
ncbi:protein Spindly [Orussus abietinus]|uniref:protein Spindly n=1 Tax=Orussus abietinus TaxID=222816 RepID=UPI000626D505|nr:protein Spindly [Orussus abietinus]XP_012282144.1 protein Spindly [Orussus abietinus]XP_012282145.1 protein Spindly [Orussus abietinus]